MEFSLFQLLILLLLFYPLIRRLLGGGSKQQQEEEEAQTGYDPYSRTGQQSEGRSSRTQETYRQKQQETGDQSWEDFFEGLEKVLAGEEQESQTTRSQGHNRPDRPQGGGVRDQRRTTASTASSDTRRSQGSSQSQRHPLEGPVYGSSGSSRYSESEKPGSSDPFSYDQSDEAGIGKQSELVDRELTESDNPIYTGLDEVTEVTALDSQGTKKVKKILKDPERLRDGILLKEILGPPKSRRRHHHSF